MAEIRPNQSGSGGQGQAGAMKAVRWAFVMIVIIVAAGTFAGARGCETLRGTRELKDGERVPVVVAGKTFNLEPALDDTTRVRGLGGRLKIEPEGGMIFVFPVFHRMEFVMRDCPVEIDLAFLDDAGRVLALHAMKPDAPKDADETDLAYETRLRRYSSRFPCRVAVEFAGGTLAGLGVKEGDRIGFELAPLKARAQ